MFWIFEKNYRDKKVLELLERCKSSKIIFWPKYEKTIEIFLWSRLLQSNLSVLN
jgi:hypothetical protein